MMSSDQAYAQAISANAAAEGNTDQVRSEMLAVSEAVESNGELRSNLTNKMLPASTRFQIVTDALSGKVSDTTLSIISMLAANGQGGNLTAIASSFASTSGGAVQLATVKSAVPLTDAQIQRLSANLVKVAGGPVEVRNVVDESVVGGVVTTIGDNVIDGSIRAKLDKMKEAL